jgi:hypothetical protein
MMGLYNIAAHKELKTIKDIRNKFAHNLSTKSFDGSQQICSFASNLKLADQVPIYLRAKTVLFTSAIVMLTIGSEPDEPSVPLLPTIANQTPRQRYTRACQFFIAALSIVPEWESQRPTAFFNCGHRPENFLYKLVAARKHVIIIFAKHEPSRLDHLGRDFHFLGTIFHRKLPFCDGEPSF